MTFEPYRRKAQYYETDAMAIIHHANYIHWFEEARIDFMDKLGYTYARMEQDGIASPVLGAQCDYKRPVRFGDTVLIEVSILEMTGAKMTVGYRVLNEGSRELCASGETRHGFIDIGSGRPVSLKRVNPALFSLLVQQMNPANR